MRLLPLLLLACADPATGPGGLIPGLFVPVDDSGAPRPPEDSAAPDTAEVPDTAGVDTSEVVDSADTGGDTGGGAEPTTPMPDFALVDLNPNSTRAGELVSPRDYLEQVSGWYFTHAS